MSLQKKYPEPRLEIEKRSFSRMTYLIVFVLFGMVCFSGCRKAPTGDAAAVQKLYGQRMGVVIRATRYLYGEHGGKQVTHNRYVASDSPNWVYSFSINSRDDIEASLKKLFQPVMLNDDTLIWDYTSELKLDGDFILVTPNSPNTIIPPDDTLKQIMQDEDLAGLIVLDQNWYLDAKNLKTLSCKVEINLLDIEGNIVFYSDPGLQMDGHTKYSSLVQDIMQIMTFSVLGEPNIHNLHDALTKVSAEMADSIINRVIEFAPNK